MDWWIDLCWWNDQCTAYNVSTLFIYQFVFNSISIYHGLWLIRLPGFALTEIHADLKNVHNTTWRLVEPATVCRLHILPIAPRSAQSWFDGHGTLNDRPAFKLLPPNSLKHIHMLFRMFRNFVSYFAMNSESSSWIKFKKQQHQIYDLLHVYLSISTSYDIHGVSERSSCVFLFSTETKGCCLLIPGLECQHWYLQSCCLLIGCNKCISKILHHGCQYKR